VPTSSGAPFIVTVGSGVCGVYAFTILATGTDSQQTSHQVPVTFTANSYTPPNYTLDVTPDSQTAPVNTPAIFNGTLRGTDCYSSPVNLSCGSNGPPNCRVSPDSLVPTVSPAPPAPFTVSVSSNVDQTYSFNIAGVGTDALKRQQQKLISFVSTGGSGARPFSFAITPASSIESLPAGQPATYVLDLVPSRGAFPSNVTLAYSGNCPPISTCTLTPMQVSKGSSQTTQITFTVTTTAPVIAAVASARALRSYAVWLSLPGLIVVLGTRRWKRLALFFLVALMVPGLWLEIACSSGLQGNGTGPNGQAGTPSGTYIMTISATVSSLPQQTAQVQLTVN
jgi:hypothetical protein